MSQVERYISVAANFNSTLKYAVVFDATNRNSAKTETDVAEGRSVFRPVILILFQRGCI